METKPDAYLTLYDNSKIASGAVDEMHFLKLYQHIKCNPYDTNPRSDLFTKVQHIQETPYTQLIKAQILSISSNPTEVNQSKTILEGLIRHQPEKTLSHLLARLELSDVYFNQHKKKDPNDLGIAYGSGVAHLEVMQQTLAPDPSTSFQTDAPALPIHKLIGYQMHLQFGLHFINRDTPQYNPQQAINHFRLAFDDNDSDPYIKWKACFYLGIAHFKKFENPDFSQLTIKTSVSKESSALNESIRFFNLFIENNTPPKGPFDDQHLLNEACFRLATICLNNYNPPRISEAHKYLKQSADRQHPSSQFGVGYIYYSGHASLKDWQQAAAYLEIFLKHDNNAEDKQAKAQAYLTDIYQQGSSNLAKNPSKVLQHATALLDNRDHQAFAAESLSRYHWEQSHYLKASEYAYLSYQWYADQAKKEASKELLSNILEHAKKANILDQGTFSFYGYLLKNNDPQTGTWAYIQQHGKLNGTYPKCTELDIIHCIVLAEKAFTIEEKQLTFDKIIINNNGILKQKPVEYLQTVINPFRLQIIGWSLNEKNNRDIADNYYRAITTQDVQHKLMALEQLCRYDYQATLNESQSRQQAWLKVKELFNKDFDVVQRSQSTHNSMTQEDSLWIRRLSALQSTWELYSKFERFQTTHSTEKSKNQQTKQNAITTLTKDFITPASKIRESAPTSGIPEELTELEQACQKLKYELEGV